MDRTLVFFATLFFGLFAVVPTQAAILFEVTDLPRVQYDFIIVGGGTAGLVVANRLTENPKFEVLVLEAGPSHENVLVSEVPLFASLMLPNTTWDWNYTMTPQPGLGGRSSLYPRPRILGGSSSANYLMWNRGSHEDWDRYAQVTGDDGWSWTKILPYFKKLEKWTPPADNHNITGQFNPSVHSFNGGINSISLAGCRSPIEGRVLAAIRQLGGEFSPNLDVNSGYPLGMSYVQSSIDGSKRSSSATAYLASQFLNRQNLHVLVNAQVTRVVKTSDGPTPAFRTIEFRRTSGGPLIRISAKKEVILSAGAIDTPHVLLNSGIGNTEELRGVGVEPTLDLPDVGQRLADHAIVPNHWLVNSTDTFETTERNQDVAARDFALWQNGTGPYVDTITTQWGFMRVPKTVHLPEPDSAAGSDTPHYEIFVSNGLVTHPTPPKGNFIAIVSVIVSPSSRGSVKIRSNDPFDKPIIDPGFFTTDFDKVVMREAVRSALHFAAAPAWEGYILAATGGMVNMTTDADIDAYVAASAGTIFHPVGSASMSPLGARWGVVDPDLQVKNAEGLRVVDASVMPYIPAGHVQGAVYAIAERAADLIKVFYSH